MTSLSPLRFLEAIWPAKLLTNETLELRLIDRQDNNSIMREFFNSPKELLERALHVEGQDVYFGVSTRFGNSGKKRDCYRVKCVWVDLDNKQLEDCNFDLNPDFVVKSGVGFHCYWTLTSPYLVRGEIGRSERIENINWGLAKKLGGDVNCCDVSRILRVPNTLNHKYIPLKLVKAFAF